MKFDSNKYIGLVVNGLTVLSFSHKKDYSSRSKHYFFNFKCHCGKEKILCYHSVKSGKTTSCGCKRINEAIEKKAGLKVLYNTYKSGAKKRGYDFTLSIETFAKMTSKNCYYCGIKPSNSVQSYSTHSTYIYNGLDRVDNQKGYSEENIVPCCKLCNRAKSDLTYEEFINWINRLKKL